ncbi:hypothetical protein GCM10007382_17060 [Salinibacterium xinjiangense]|uniref:hypothetical protein n=1 Tax=Salinibacterium xinjiangense TaxID=386302 RepID=UPI0015C8530D|nr:hypothetical protein [Salinibacterium xinjiangense]GGK97409.1 hypothetical protein GCM10007382_17060 [Salinibacterium xinjiangense]
MIDDVHLDIYLSFESQLGSNPRLRIEVLAEYPDELSFEKWTLMRLEAHIATTMAALLDRHFSEKGKRMPARFSLYSTLTASKTSPFLGSQLAPLMGLRSNMIGKPRAVSHAVESVT